MRVKLFYSYSFQCSVVIQELHFVPLFLLCGQEVLQRLTEMRKFRTGDVLTPAYFENTITQTVRPAAKNQC